MKKGGIEAKNLKGRLGFEHGIFESKTRKGGQIEDDATQKL